ncbi:unnamed protein product [Vitrella brassicaformis CCMP3155]|uniref:Uncharacterized protein n=1 Tax=Vitrella brassicaformis (strain CCMP3155) TaxID=1169540 RepID=A0A0G4FHH9_VITBC|nr:unnamed protein product [Vitrella brassicaformis CCMP3155]|eukprot:CEM12913.1 unnamed protein product [Vitrella brassicaformis CCMP3155]
MSGRLRTMRLIIDLFILGTAGAAFISRHLATGLLARRSPRHVTARRTLHDDQEERPWYLVDREARVFIGEVQCGLGYDAQWIHPVHPPLILYAIGWPDDWSRLKEKYSSHLIQTSPGDEDEMTSLVAHKGFDMRTIKDDWNSGRLQEQIELMMLMKKKMRGWAYNTERGGGQWEYENMDIQAACFITGGPEVFNFPWGEEALNITWGEEAFDITLGEEAFKRWIGNKAEDEAMNEALQYLSDMNVSLFYYSSSLLGMSTYMQTGASLKKRLNETGRQRDEYEQWVAERSTTDDFQQWRAERAKRRKREREELDERAEKVMAVQSMSGTGAEKAALKELRRWERAAEEEAEKKKKKQQVQQAAKAVEKEEELRVQEIRELREELINARRSFTVLKVVVGCAQRIDNWFH